MQKKITSKKSVKILHFKVNTGGLLKEIMQNKETSVLKIPLQIFANLLLQVAERACQINDDKLNSLMARLALYEQTDPYSKEFNKKLTNQLLGNK